MTRKLIGTVVAIATLALICNPKAGLLGEQPKGATPRPKSIKDRFVPPVAGIDLEQALNYVDSEGLDMRCSWLGPIARLR